MLSSLDDIHGMDSASGATYSEYLLTFRLASVCLIFEGFKALRVFELLVQNAVIADTFKDACELDLEMFVSDVFVTSDIFNKLF